jgi:predicted transcriptional regulator
MSVDSPRPTEAELKILAVLWQRGPSTVREVHAQLGGATGYTTILKFMQIMTDKGLLTRVERGRSHVYKPAIAQERTQKHLVGELIDKAFGGSMRKLMLAALSAKRATPEELKEIAKLIDEKSKGR